MKLVAIYKPISLDGKEYQFYTTESPFDIPKVRYTHVEESMDFAINLKARRDELKSMSDHIRRTFYVDGEIAAAEECKKIADMLDYLSLPNVRLEPSVEACCYFLFLDKEGPAMENMALKKKILYSDYEALGFFLTELYKRYSNAQDLSSNFGEEVMKEHRKVILRPDWITLANSIGIEYETLPKGRKQTEA